MSLSVDSCKGQVNVHTGECVMCVACGTSQSSVRTEWQWCCLWQDIQQVLGLGERKRALLRNVPGFPASRVPQNSKQESE